LASDPSPFGAQDFACGLPLGNASLTPAKRLKFMVAVREYLENFNEDIR